MCGIYCSNDLTSFEVLQQANKERGNFSTGIFYCYNKANYNIVKEKYNIDWNKTKIPDQKGHLYLGHNQAPTETGRDWNEETSHPFWVGDWIVAHNGVLTNYNELIDEYIPMHDNPVDSSIIPALLDEFEYEHGPCEDVETEVQNILYTIEKLKGTFALWIVNIKTMNVYVARQGSTLFYKDANISSIKGKGYKEVLQGILYNYSYEGLTELDGFVYNSPFLTL
jgi:glucosamine 6-phosphate synthetase-like amidotransferase/phosphosugar isomerase protein|tara:strand:- start:1658 stop:2329 length:672 start_codon:yes stop_codon:yes gene_type:complete